MNVLSENTKEFESSAFMRTEQALGSRAAKAVANARVAVIGVGGVGGWCAEALVRTGVGSLLIVDPDRVALSNTNRQIMANVNTVGEFKVDVLKRRLKEINPGLNIEAVSKRYTKADASSFGLEKYDCVVDAIDSVDDKADLILHIASLDRTVLFSSMGAAMRRDPLAVAKAEFWEVKADALARVLRSRFRKMGVFPKARFNCVYSKERPLSPEDAPPVSEKRAYGSLVHVSAVFGFALAGMVIDEITGAAKGKIV
jgi:tRNA A37 threonylcarbamoyladenosine dehydratase